MNKYDITLQDGNKLSLFYDTIEEVILAVKRCGYDNITKENIRIDKDLLYMKYINNIINNSDGKIYIRNKEHHLYKSNIGLIPINLWAQDGFYFNGCQYIEGLYNIETKKIESFKGRYTPPIGWNISDPEEFLKLFGTQKIAFQPMEFISKTTLIKELGGKLINRKTKYIYKDKYEYYYIFDKNDVNNKEYKQFKNNKEAVLIKYQYNDFDEHTKWFNCLSEFVDMWNKEYESKIPSLKSSSAKYDIIRKGYNKISPEKRRVILRLPYFNINMYEGLSDTDDFKKHLITTHLITEMNKYKHLSFNNVGFDNTEYEMEILSLVKIIWDIEKSN